VKIEELSVICINVWFRERKEMSVLREGVYMMKSEDQDESLREQHGKWHCILMITAASTVNAVTMSASFAVAEKL